MLPLAFLSNSYVKYGLVALAAVLVVGGIYWKGRSDGKAIIEAKYAEEKIRWEQQIANMQQNFDQSTTEIVENYQQQLDAHKRAIETLKKNKVVKYVGESKCQLTNGFVDLHNTTAKGKEPSDPKPNAYQPSNKTINDAATAVSQNYLICAENANKLKALQEVVKSFQQAQQALTE